MDRSPQCSANRDPRSGIARPPRRIHSVVLALLGAAAASDAAAVRALPPAGRRGHWPDAIATNDGFNVCAVDNPPNPESSSSSWRMEQEASAARSTSLRGQPCRSPAVRTPTAAKAANTTRLQPTGLQRHSAAGNRSAAAAGGEGGLGTGHTEGPRIFFLFLTISGLERQDLWQAFFAGAETAQYRSFMHCTDKAACDRNLAKYNPIGITVVDSVPTYYCRDLVSAMVQLIQAARWESRSADDRFVFVSESTLPLKPFQVVYHQLNSDPDSGFCIYTKKHWVRLSLSDSKTALIVKHSQWVALRRDHAEVVADGWQRLKAQLFAERWSLPVWIDGENRWSTITSQGNVPLPMCVDEWAMFVTIYGAILHDGTQMELKNLPGFGPQPLQLRGYAPNHATQGVCRTFAFWSAEDDLETADLVKAVAPGLSCYPTCAGTHPAEFLSVTDEAAQALRRSPFLFARKFRGGAMSWDQFQRIIIGGQ